ncbi:MAG: hypothetical protein U9N44_07615 [Chloroflexota bacterium]|nr:hypothetical protein [Chloroflexota bacterium]
MLSRKAVIAVLSMAMLLLPAFAGCGGEDESIKVAVIQIGAAEDYGWTYEGHLGAEGMSDTLSYVVLSESEDIGVSYAATAMRGYADEGCDVIFCHSYDYGPYTSKK